MAQRNYRDYEVSLWSLQDSFIAILKQYGLEYKGQIQKGKLQLRDDGTQTFSFTIPMYYRKDGLLIENPSWYNVLQGTLLANMRKVKVIFNKENTLTNPRKIYEFLIVKVKERHEKYLLFCDIECLGLAFHELGKIGYKISLTADDFYNDDYKWSTEGKWYDSLGNEHSLQPLATLNYWNNKVFSTVNNWTYDIQMNWSGYSLYLLTQTGIEEDLIDTNDVIHMSKERKTNCVYEDDFVDSWAINNDDVLVPAHITRAKEKTRINVDISLSNIYNITQHLAEIFNVYCKYVYEYDNNFHIIARKVVYYNNFINEQNGIIDINYKHQTSSISRLIDSTDLVTKLFVKGIEDSTAADGSINILNVDANKSKEDYILNFDYLHEIGGITLLQYQSANLYIRKIREINLLIDSLSDIIITSLSELVKFLAELTVITNAITKDTEELFSNKELLNALTSNDEVLHITSNNPQLAVLLKDTSKDYNSYFVKITQKGVYPLSIKLYKTYSYANAKLTDEITIGKVEFDEFGNVVRVSNLYIADTESKTVYLIYDYRPSLYYERIQGMWLSRLAADTARKAELLSEIIKTNYVLYGLLPEKVTTPIKVNDICEFNVKLRYTNLLLKKELLIKEFNLSMGAAIRLGYWQPDDYTDYGTRYNESLKVGGLHINDDNVSTKSGKALFKWDNKLFDDEQKLYYEYSAAQQKIVYPCIDLTKHPLILELIQKNFNKNICFYYNPISSLEDTRYARVRPAICKTPEVIYVIEELTSWQKTLALKSFYPDFFTNEKYKQYTGIVCQEWTDDSYKVGYSAFKWQLLRPGRTNWIDITTFTLNPGVDYGTEDKYIMTEKSLAHLQFTYNPDFIQEIKLLSSMTSSYIPWDNCQLRLYVKNNIGSNLNADGLWDNGEYSVSPTLVKRLINNGEFIAAEQYKNQCILPPTALRLPLTIGFSLTDNHTKDPTMKYQLQYVRVGAHDNNPNINLTSWVNNNDAIDESSWINVDDNNSIFDFSYFSLDDTGIQYKLIMKLNITFEAGELWRFRLRFKNAVDYLNDTDWHYSIDNSRVCIGSTTPIFSHIGNNQTYIDLDRVGTYKVVVYMDCPMANRSTSGDPTKYNVSNLNIIWKKVDSNGTLTDIEEDLLTDYLTITKSLSKNDYLNKYYATLMISRKSEAIADGDALLLKLDGYYIYPLIVNNNGLQMIIPDNYTSLVQLDCYRTITLSTNLQDSFIYNLNWYENDEIQYDEYNFSITGKNIDNFTWHIKIIYNALEKNINISTITSLLTLIVISNQATNNKYQVTKTENINNTTTLTLTLLIPQVSQTTLNLSEFYNAILFNQATIQCEVWNQTDGHFSRERLSHLFSNLCNIKVSDLLMVNNLPENLNVYYDWYPKWDIHTEITNWNQMSTLPYKIPFTVSFLQIPGQSTSLELGEIVSCTVEQTPITNVFEIIKATLDFNSYHYESSIIEDSTLDPITHLTKTLLFYKIARQYIVPETINLGISNYQEVPINIIGNMDLLQDDENTINYTSIDEVMQDITNRNTTEEDDSDLSIKSECFISKSSHITRSNNINYHTFNGVLQVLLPKLCQDADTCMDNFPRPGRAMFEYLGADGRFALYYKIKITYTLGSNIFTREHYIRVTIRFRAPQFLPNSKWEPETENYHQEYAKGLTLLVENIQNVVSSDDLVNIIRQKLRRAGLMLMLNSNTYLNAQDFGFDDNTVNHYQWQLEIWYNSSINETWGYTQWTCKDLRTLRINTPVAYRDTLLPATIFTLDDPEAHLLISRPFGDANYRTSKGNQGYPENHTDYILNGLIDTYSTTNSKNYVVGYVRNLYLVATNWTTSTRTKIFDVLYDIKNSVPSSLINGGKILVFDPKESGFKFLSNSEAETYRSQVTYKGG